ncbi:unnamed protein product [Mucor hiemalis]
MRFSLASLFVVMFSAAHAASIHMDRRAAANVESCTKSFTDISNQINTLQPVIIAGGIVDTSREYVKLEDNIRASQVACCVITTPISDADADYFLNEYGNTTTHVQSLMSTITSKAKDYNFITRAVIKGRIEELNDLTNSLNTCLNVFTPATKATILQDDIAKINASFTSTHAAYDNIL